MYSFYGGRPGNSFTIVEHFDSVNEMQTEFKKGSEYTKVHYNQHVIIDTPNKNNKDNGKIYKRGYEYTNDEGGAIYIGQIVGPSGMAPDLQLVPYNDSHIANETEKQLTASNISLVPGKLDNNTFNDSINYKTVAIRNADNTDAIAYIGFKIPYTCFEFTAERGNPYDGPIAEKIDNNEHPFFAEWKITIPGGIKGDSLNNIEIITVNNTNISNIQYPDNINEEDLLGKKIVAYKIKNYDDAESGTISKYYFCGYYNDIKNVELSEDGTLTISYNGDNNNDSFNNKIKWIDSVTLIDGKLKFRYNTGDQSQQFIIKYVNDIQLEEDGTVTLKYNTKENNSDNYETAPLDQKIKWINSMNVTEGGIVNVRYNTDNQTDVPINAGKPIKWITKIDTVPMEDGSTKNKLVAIFNDNTRDDLGPEISTINNLQLNQNGDLQAQYGKDQDFITINDNAPIKWIREVFHDTSNNKLIFYDNTSNERSQNTMLGSVDYRTVHHLTYDESTGEVKVHYSETDIGTALNGNAPISYINSMDLTNGGIINAHYNITPNINNPINNENPIRWINSINMTNDGIINVRYNTASSTDVSINNDNPVKWIQNIEIENGTPHNLKITYNTNQEINLGSLYFVEGIRNTHEFDNGYIDIMVGGRNEGDNIPNIEVLESAKKISINSYNENATMSEGEINLITCLQGNSYIGDNTSGIDNLNLKGTINIVTGQTNFKNAKTSIQSRNSITFSTNDNFATDLSRKIELKSDIIELQSRALHIGSNPEITEIVLGNKDAGTSGIPSTYNEWGERARVFTGATRAKPNIDHSLDVGAIYFVIFEHNVQSGGKGLYILNGESATPMAIKSIDNVISIDQSALQNHIFRWSLQPNIDYSPRCYLIRITG